MAEWKTYKLGDVCRSVSNTYKSNAEKVVLINTSDVLDGKCLNHIRVKNENLKGQFKKTFQKNDILYSEIRPANKRFAFVDFDPQNYIASTKLMVIRVNDKILPLYLFYILSSQPIIDQLQVLAESRSGTFPQITFGELSNIDVLLPDIGAQQQIIDILSSLDDKIENNRKINENLEQQAEALFKYYFDSSNNLLDDASVVSLTEIAEYLNGLAMQKFPALNGDESLPVLKIKELGQGQCDKNSDRCSDRIDEKYLVRDGDIIFSWSGTLLVDIWCGGDCGLNQHLFKVTPKGYPKWFVYFWTKKHLDKFIRIAKDKAVTMGHIRRGDLDSSEVLVPSEKVMQCLDKILNPILQKIIDLRIENRNLAKTRDLLLPKLMSGEIKL